MKLTAAAAVVLGLAQPALADQAETKGGMTVKTDDGRFTATLGGRIHFDGNIIDEDTNAKFGSSAAPAQSGFYFRRVYLTMKGKAYGWNYKIEPDFANNNASGATSIAFQDAYLATDLGPGEIQFGQRKPFRAMEDLTSSNDVLMIERPFASASGGFLKGGKEREFQDGVFYHGNGDAYTWGIGGYSLRAMNMPGTEGLGESARVTFAPLMTESGSIIHVGVSYSDEHPANDQGGAQTCTNAAPATCTAVSSTASAPIGAGSFAYAGRRGPSFNLGTTPGKLSTLGVEYANVIGPFFLQAEYMTQKQKEINAAGNSQTIDGYYAQASFFVTGETKPYKKADGVFGSPKPLSDMGAFEITARYDGAKNKTFDGTAATNGSSCSTAALDTKCEIKALTFGTNYYFNPNVRFMLNYVIGEADRGGTNGKDKPKAIAARFQMNW